MFDQLRRNTKTIIWLVSIAFLGLIFLAWGADFQLGGKTKAVPGQIGLVDGTPITSQVYEQLVSQTRANYQQQSGREVDDRTEVMIRNQTWNDLIQELLLRKEARRRGITVTDEEVVQGVLNQPPASVMQNPAFQTDGRFDLGKYQAALRDPNVDTRGLEEQIRSSLPLQKLQMAVAGSVILGDDALWDAFVAQNEKIKVSYVLVPASKAAVDEASIPREVMEAYYRGHQTSYRLPQQAVCELVNLPRRMSLADSLNIVDQAKTVVSEFRGGEDFTVLLDAYSDAMPNMRGGPNGMYVSAAQISDPSVRDAAFSLPIGGVSDVLLGNSGVHVIQVEDRKTEAAGQTVKFADVFIPYKPSPETLTQIRDEIFQVRQEASTRDFAAVAGEMKLKVREIGPFGEKDFIPGLSPAPEVTDFVFSNPSGTISAPMERADGWYVIRIKERRAPRAPDFNEVQDRVRAEVADSLRCDQAVAVAARLLKEVESGKTLAAAAKDAPGATFGTTEPFARLGFARGLGSDPTILGPLFASEPGLVRRVVRGRTVAVIASVDERTPASREQFEAQKSQLRQSLLQRMQGQVLNDWIAQLRKNAKISDFRSGFYD